MGQRPPLEQLPLFASDADIGRALLGDRARDWPGLAALLERRGLPKIDPVMGGRYVPAVRRFFDIENGVATLPIPAAADGVEDTSAWNRKQKKRQG